LHKCSILKKKILITPLSWGIGHATRCIPIIEELIKFDFEPIIATSGDALSLLRKEFPNLRTITLPRYNIKYPKNSSFLRISLFFQMPRLFFVIKKERQQIEAIVKKEVIYLIINDNRFGCFSKKVPTIYITHQINVLSGFTTFLTSKIHQFLMRKANKIWIPDDENFRLSGRLSETTSKNVYYTGVLSRFKLPKKSPKIKYDILVLLSGVETQRVMLEKILIKELTSLNKKILFVRGSISDKGKIENSDCITFLNYLLKDELQEAILESNLVIARSGYSTIMDLAVLQKKCFFIPTPNQNEQEYLARQMQKLQIAPYAKQADFKAALLNKIENFNGFAKKESQDVLEKLILSQL